MPSTNCPFPRPALTLALTGALLLSACGGDGPAAPPQVVDVVLHPTVVTLLQKESVTLHSKPVDAEGNRVSGIPVVLESMDESLVAIDQPGRITSVGPIGSTSVLVRAGNVVKEVPVTVNAVEGSIEVTPNPVVLPQLGTAQLEVTVRDRHGELMPSARVRFYKDGPGHSLIVLTEDGLIKSTGNVGTATLRIETGENIRQMVTVDITQVPTSIRVPESLRVRSTNSAALPVEVIDLIGGLIESDLPLTYESSNESIVAIDQEGMLTSVGPTGDAAIDVTLGELSARTHVKVLPVLAANAFLEGRLEGTVQVPVAFGVAFSPAGPAYASSRRSGVYELSLDSRTARNVAETVAGLDLMISHDGMKAYVANQQHDGGLYVELASGSVVTADEPSPSSSALSVLLAEDHDVLLLGTNSGIQALDPTTLESITRIPAGPVIHMTRHPVRPVIYASGHIGSAIGKVYEISLTTLSIVREFSGLGQTQGVAVSPDGTELYVADEAGAVHVVDLEAGSKVATIPLPHGAYGMVASHDGPGLYVTMPAGALAIMDAELRSVVRTVQLGGSLRRAALSPDGSTLLVSDDLSGRVLIIR